MSLLALFQPFVSFGLVSFNPFSSLCVCSFPSHLFWFSLLCFPIPSLFLHLLDLSHPFVSSLTFSCSSLVIPSLQHFPFPSSSHPISLLLFLCLFILTCPIPVSFHLVSFDTFSSSSFLSLFTLSFLIFPYVSSLPSSHPLLSSPPTLPLSSCPFPSPHFVWTWTLLHLVLSMLFCSSSLFSHLFWSSFHSIPSIMSASASSHPVSSFHIISPFLFSSPSCRPFFLLLCISSFVFSSSLIPLSHFV